MKFFQKFFFIITLITILTLLSYYYLDRQVSWFIAKNHIKEQQILKIFTFLPTLFIASATTIVLIQSVRLFSNRPLSPKFSNYAAISIGLLTTIFFKNLLKKLFGRSWPKTWVCNNPSLIQNHVYSFHFFKGGFLLESFPSGHATVMAFCATILSSLFPKMSWVFWVLWALTCLGLIGMNYHFVGDVVAGTGFGIIAAMIMMRWIVKTSAPTANFSDGTLQ